MIWFPYYLKFVIDSSLEIKNISDQKRIEALTNSIKILEDRIANKEISNAELKACRRLNYPNSAYNESDPIFSLKQRISKIYSTIFQESEKLMIAETLYDTISLLPKQKKEPVLNVVYLCDMDCEDHNGAIVGRIDHLLKEKVPFIVTKSLLNLTDLENEKKKDLKEQNQLAIYNKHHKWIIYKKGEFVVFIPKSYPFSVEKLRFNLSPENLITDLVDIFEGPTGNHNADNFIDLFKRTKDL